MRIPLLLAASTLALAAHAAVTVTFVEPDKYTDIGRFHRADREGVLKDLEGHLVKLGESLPAGQNLAIEILDIDLAGEERFVGTWATDVRIQTGRADWPTIRLRYVLERDGRKESGEQTLADMSYQQRPPPVSSTETLPHEKRMLTEWFRRFEFSTPPRPAFALQPVLAPPLGLGGHLDCMCHDVFY